MLSRIWTKAAAPVRRGLALHLPERYTFCVMERERNGLETLNAQLKDQLSLSSLRVHAGGGPAVKRERTLWNKSSAAVQRSKMLVQHGTRDLGRGRGSVGHRRALVAHHSSPVDHRRTVVDHRRIPVDHRRALFRVSPV